MTVFGRHSDTEAANERELYGRPGDSRPTDARMDGPIDGPTDGLGAVGLGDRSRDASTVPIAVVPEDADPDLVDDVDLSDDPFADDLSDQLAARGPRQYLTRSTAILAALVLLAGGFLAGAQVQKHYGVASTGTANAPAGGQRGLGGGGFGGFGGGGNGGASAAAGGQTGRAGSAANATSGTVKFVDGTTVYIQTSDGQTVTVRTNPSTAVQLSQKGAVSDLSVGSTVTVEGSTGSNGDIAATKVTKN